MRIAAITLVVVATLLAGACAADTVATVFSDDFSTDTGAWTPSPSTSWTLGAGLYTGDDLGLSTTMTGVPVLNAFSLDVDLRWLQGNSLGSPNYGVAGFMLTDPNEIDPNNWSAHLLLNRDQNGNVTLIVLQFDNAGGLVLYQQSQTKTIVGNSFHLKGTRPVGASDLELLLTGDVNGGLLYIYVSGFQHLDSVTQHSLKVYQSKWEFDNYREDVYGASTVGTTIRSISDPIVSASASQRLFTVWGKATVVNANRVTLNDGSPGAMEVYVPGHALQDSAFARISGVISDFQGQKVLSSSPALVTVH